MVARFSAAFRPTGAQASGGHVWRDARLVEAKGYLELADACAGRSFDDGLYRLHDDESGPRALRLLEEAFPEFAGTVVPFGQDWLGRQFALDMERREKRQPLVLLFEPGTGEALDIPADFTSFHRDVLVNRRDDALASQYFDEWRGRNSSMVPLGRNMCVGYRVPLFLGGEDSLDNLEVTDLEVYWDLSGQLRLGTLDLPEGSEIGEIRTTD